MKQNLAYYTFLQCCLALPLALFLSCSPEKERPSPLPPNARIISLSPSISRQIADLGRRDLIVGVTSFDDFRNTGIAIVGTLVQPNLEAIIYLKPGIVFLSSEDGPVQNIDRLEDAGVRMYRFGRNRNFHDICDNYLRLGAMLGREREAREKIARYSGQLDRARARHDAGDPHKPATVAFFLSYRPLIAVSEGSFVAQIIRDAGGACAYSGTRGAYPLVSLESLVESDPAVIIYMAGDNEAGAFFRRLSRDFRNLKVVRDRSFYVIAPDTIPFYTPADYVMSVDMISEILVRVVHTGPLR